MKRTVSGVGPLHEAYTLMIYRNQEDFDRVIAPMLAQAPSYHRQDALAKTRTKSATANDSCDRTQINRPYTNCLKGKVFSSMLILYTYKYMISICLIERT